MVDLLKKLLIMAGSGATSVLVAACYGPRCVMTSMDRTLRVVAPNGQPIPGLKVTVRDTGAESYTDEQGNVRILVRYCEDEADQYKALVRIEDVDGEENGLYESTEREVAPGDSPVTVIMTPAN